MTRTCAADVYFCKSGNVVTCDATGTELRIADACVASEYCRDGYNTCRTDVCWSGQRACGGDNVLRCNDEGSDWSVYQVCATGRGCSEGACRPKDCEEEGYYCSGGDVWICTGFGDRLLNDACSKPGEHCVPGLAWCEF